MSAPVSHGLNVNHRITFHVKYTNLTKYTALQPFWLWLMKHRVLQDKQVLWVAVQYSTAFCKTI